MNAPTSDNKTDNINAARETLDRNLMILSGKVEAVANSPTLLDDQRLGIVHSAGMNVKAQVVPHKRVFSVVNGNMDGSVHLTAPGGVNAHEWQYTSDTTNFTGRLVSPTTTKSTTDISGLKSGTRYAFFHKPIEVGVENDWEGPLFLTVQ